MSSGSGSAAASGGEVLAQVQHGPAVDLDLDDTVVGEITDPTVQPPATGTETCDQPVVQVVPCRRPVSGQVGEDRPPSGVVEIGKARPSGAG
jgi:hypothetical protein